MTAQSKAQPEKKNHPTVLVNINIDASIEKSFQYIVPVDLSHIFKRYKNLPAVDSTGNKDLWYKPGMQRTVYFEDGNTAREHLLTVNPYTDFSYKIEDFTSPLKRLTKYIYGKWVFTETADGKTHIEWSYTLVTKNIFARLIVNVFVKKNIKGMLTNALSILKTDLESGNLYQPSSKE
ncbi:SRPBCC family protein [Abyssalbus ytuae]|uniref:SRPBCC family protein n=1 Tax=Abyssalbus ytuae TaxID=2926907 RepID=A0A9E6ZKL2_9FLAO|nr:SRPBCC family protein [Abyssalbus ytuae]UOB17444.1 SRPBCC family protein [Abyssalbus ytuae]